MPALGHTVTAMTSLPVDYLALAAQATTDHAAANQRHQEAVRDSQLAAFAQLVFTAAGHDVSTVKLTPSDQGDWMSVASYDCPDGEPTGDVDDLEEAMDDAVSDLPDTIHSYWADLPGVTYDGDRRYGDKATVDVHAAATALLEQTQQNADGAESATGPAPVVVREQEMVGKTVASVTAGEEQVRDTYKDEYTVERTLITFTDGTQAMFGEVHMDLYSID